MFGVSCLQLGITEILTLSLLTVVILYFIYGRGKSYNLPPGPTPLPLIGNILLFVRSKKLSPLVLVDLAKEYGPIYHISFGSIKGVVINNYELTKEALLTKPTEFAGRPKSYSGDLFTEGGKDIAFADYGPTWRLQRKIASKAIRAYLTGPNLEKRVHDATRGVLDAMAIEKQLFNPKDYMSMLVVNFIASFCFGESYSFDDPSLRKLVDLTDIFVEKLSNGLPEDFLPFLEHFNLKQSREARAIAKGILDEFHQKYEAHRKSFDPDNIGDFTDCLIAAELEARTEEAPEELAKLTHTHFVQILADIYGAGVDTSRFTLHWAILHMVAFPDIQEKVFNEIQQVVGTTRMPGVEDKKQLRYTEATLFESMRMGTVAPIGLPHAAMVDAQIGGYDVPKGTLVVINHWALHHDPTFWDAPEEFRPERFLEADGSPAPKPDNFLPFSMGRRVCLGESVAKPELLMMFSGLIQKFKFSLPQGEKANLEPFGGAAGFVPQPFQITLEPRY